MRVQLANPSAHRSVASLPFSQPLAEWDLPDIHGVLGLHRHVVRLVELGTASYVVKELPDPLAQREYRLLRWLADEGLPTVEVVAVVTDRADGLDGMLVTRHLDYSLPYRSLLSGRGLTIPYLGERLLDALVGLLVRLHLAGFFWGDCSLSNTLFRRDAGALHAYLVDLETGERQDELSDALREHDLEIAEENITGELL
ncbi:MAG TPA: lipopolysaccharide kinase InaA family protein, partial [Ilumatobacteraceae bacterium]